MNNQENYFFVNERSYELTVDSHKAYSPVKYLLHYLLLVHT